MFSFRSSFATAVRPFAVAAMVFLLACAVSAASENRAMEDYVLDFETPADAGLQERLVAIDAKVRAELEIPAGKASAGLLDLRTLRLALIDPDRIEYGASVPKIGILLAYFQLHPEAVENLDDETRHALGLMAKISNNEMAARFTLQMGLKRVQEVLNSYQFYDAERGGGLWVGKHYGIDDERFGDPVGDNSHGVTARQVLRYFLLLEQGKLVSPEASRAMRGIFAYPRLPHDQIKFVKALAGRDREIIRKWGSWKHWLHDSAVVSGEGRHYILVGITHHPRGDDYLEALAAAVDDLLAPRESLP
jgi:beta-lactamase class A